MLFKPYLFALLICGAVVSASGRVLAAAAAEPPTVDAAVAAFIAAQEQAFEAQLDALGQDASTGSAVALIRRCEFIGRFVDEESGQWIDAASALHTSCIEQLQSRYSDVPEAQVFLFEQDWGDGVATQGEALLKSGVSWDRALRRRLVEHMYWNDSQGRRAGSLALLAAELGNADLVDEAAAFLIRQRKHAEASAVLAKAEPTDEAWEANARLRVALDLPDPQVAQRELKRHAAIHESLDAPVVARIELRSGRLVEAHEALRRDGAATEDGFATVAFDVAMARREWRAASKHAAFVADDFSGSIERALRLLKQHPASFGWRAIWPAVGVLATIVFVLALLPGLLLVPVHYRGLIRRARGDRPSPLFARIGLWQAWFGCAVMFCVPFMALIATAPAEFVSLLDGKIDLHSAHLFPAVLGGTLASLLILMPSLPKFGRRQLGWGSATITGAWRIPLALLLIWAVGYALMLAQSGEPNETLQTRFITNLVIEGGNNYGLPLVMLLLAVCTPVLEELVFRGLLLGGLTQHIRFGWANLIQALMFALIHDDPPRFLYYFALGMFAGWLVRWSGALAPAIVLHLLNNLVAVWMRSAIG